MRRRVMSSCIAAMLSFGVVAFAQTTGQNPTGSSGQAGSQTMTQSQAGDRAQTEQQLTLVGCVQREAEFRQAAGTGSGGAAGSGIGAGNEFVLAKAKPSTEAGATSAASAAASEPTSPATSTATTATSTATTATGTPTTATGTPETPTATAGTSGTASSTTTTMSSGGVAYSLTGNRESELEKHVGQRVEIVGTLEDSDDDDAPASGAAASGTVSGSASQRVGDLKTVKIVSFRALGACTP
jgi:hypothetical protein